MDHGLRPGGDAIRQPAGIHRAIEIAREQPNTIVLVSSTWANGSDVLLRFFADDLSNLRMGNINAFALEYRPLDRNTLFVMTQEDVDFIFESDKFTDITIEEVIDYPDGSPGFYFVRLSYVMISKPSWMLNGSPASPPRGRTTNNDQTVQVEYPTLDINEIETSL